MTDIISGTYKSRRVPDIMLIGNGLRKLVKIGIYRITCLATGVVYIGQSHDVDKRFRQHRNDLRAGRHKNRHLQRSWNKYDEKQFSFFFLEQVNTTDLNDAEQKWIDFYKQNVAVYNACPVAGSTKGYKHTEQQRINSSQSRRSNTDSYDFISPSGDVVLVDNLAGFCQDNNLDFRSVQKMTKGKGGIKSYKGWTTQELAQHQKQTHKLGKLQIEEIRRKADAGETVPSLAKIYDIKYKRMWEIVNRRSRTR